MRVENWDTKLSNYIVKSANKKFRYGKADCVNFVLGGIETIVGKKVFDLPYGSIKDAKKIITELNKKDELLYIFILILLLIYIGVNYGTINNNCF